jgi:ketosteroid isomerase-like protein
VGGDRAVVPWVYRKMRKGQPWHLRGVDAFTVRDGQVAAKLAYVNGSAIRRRCNVSFYST